MWFIQYTIGVLVGMHVGYQVAKNSKFKSSPTT